MVTACEACNGRGVVEVTRSRWIGGTITGYRSEFTGEVRCDACQGKGTIRRPWTDEERRAHCQQIGTLGGQATVRSRGIAFMREIARAGFATTCERYYSGNRAHARAALIQRGRHFRAINGDVS